MGWVSFLEDLEERLTEGLSQIGSLVAPTPSTSRNNTGTFLIEAEVSRRLTEWYSNARRILEDVKGCVQLANDPQIELAHDLLLLKQEVNQLREYNSELIQSCNEYRQQLAQLTSCNQELQHRMSIITREYKEQIVSYKQQIQEKDAVIQQLNNRIERLQSEKAELWQMYAPLFYEGYQNTSYESDCIGCKEAGVTEAKMCDEYSRGGLSEPSDIEYTIDDLRRKFNSKMR